MSNLDQPHPQHLGHRGFTAVEMLVTLAILAILTAIAAPGMSSLIESWRVRQAAEDLQSTLYLARSEAIRHGGSVTINATGSGWGEGWKVVTPKPDGTPEDRQIVTAPARTAIELSVAETTITADRWGVLKGGSSADFTFTLYPSSADDSSNAACLVCVSAGGRIRNVLKSTGCAS